MSITTQGRPVARGGTAAGLRQWLMGCRVEAQGARAVWRRGLVAHIERQKRYPAGAERSADIVVSFRIDHRGRLIALEIVKGSGNVRYDQAALDMVRRADPMPPPPA